MRKLVFILIISCFSIQLCFSQNNNQIEDKFLIVLDIQEYHTINKMSETSSQNFVDSVNYVINNTNPNNVIYVKSNHKVLNISTSYPFIYVSHDTSAMRLDNRLNLVNEHIFIKDKSNSFTVEELNLFLKQNNAKEIVMIGLLAEECIYGSLIAGKKLGYDMYMIPEAIIGKSQKSKNKTIKKLLKAGINILDVNELNN